MQHLRNRIQRSYHCLVALHEFPFIAGRPARHGNPRVEPAKWFRRCFTVAVRALHGDISQRVFDEAMALHMPSPELRESLYLGLEVFIPEYQRSMGNRIASPRSPRPPWILL